MLKTFKAIAVVEVKKEEEKCKKQKWGRNKKRR